MKTYSKSLLIAVAAFAVTTTGAYAHTNLLKRLDLTDEQRSALEEARELRQAGELAAARDTLLAAGFDEEVLDKLRAGHHGERHKAFWAELEETLTVEQLEALQVAKAANDHDAVKAIFEEAGIEPPYARLGHRHRMHHFDEIIEDAEDESDEEDN